MSWNKRITAKERGLIKGSIRRVFSRSDLRRRVLDSSIVPGHVDLTRPRVKTWCQCAKCGKLEAKSNIEIDHIDPVIPLNSSLESMTIMDLVDRIWCEENNLSPICIDCHDEKTRLERKERSKLKKRGK